MIKVIQMRTVFKKFKIKYFAVVLSLLFLLPFGLFGLTGCGGGERLADEEAWGSGHSGDLC